MKHLTHWPLCAVALLAPLPATSAEESPWSFDVSVYMLALGISGDLGIGPVTAGIDVNVDDVLNNLDFGAMGSVRVGYGPWALTTEVLYMGLSGSRNSINVEMDQLLLEPTLTYRVSKYVEPLAGVRYNNIWGELSGPGILPVPRLESGTQDWWDPIVGANLTLPFGECYSLNLRGDIGGFGVGSDLTWQLFPYVGWRFADWGALQVGYRWVYMDYETGSGADRFSYDLLNQGAQIGITISF